MFAIATSADIEKALGKKEYLSLEELKGRLPLELHDMVLLFN